MAYIPAESGGSDIKWTTDDILMQLGAGDNTTLTLTPPETGYVPIGWYDSIVGGSNTMGIVAKLQKFSGAFRIAFYNTTTSQANYNITVHTAWMKE